MHEDFTDRVCALFNLGLASENVELPCGNANRLWSLETTSKSFIIKEFRYTVLDAAWVAAIRAAAEFEYEIWRTGRLMMANPVRTIDDELIPIVSGSRGNRVAIRVHKRLAGTGLNAPISIDLATEAGAVLSDIQLLGRNHISADRTSLRWWRWNPNVIISRLGARGSVDAQLVQGFLSILPETEALIGAAERIDGDWTYSHYDFKPENILLTTSGLAVLDWDEANFCHPRLEAIEAAFRWSCFEREKSCADVFAAFLDGYNRKADVIDNVTLTDFGKWTAAKVGWIEYLGRRALGEFGENEFEMFAASRYVEREIESLLNLLPSIQRAVSNPG